MRYGGDGDTELINKTPMRSCFSVLYVDLVFISSMLKLVIRSILSLVIFRVAAKYLFMVNAESMIMPNHLLS